MYFASGTPSNPGERATDAWYNEIEYTANGRVSAFSMQTGHYTQVVWSETSTLGCATGRTNSGWLTVVCQYGPAGNMHGEFSDNVLPGPTKTAAECTGAGPS